MGRCANSQRRLEMSDLKKTNPMAELFKSINQGGDGSITAHLKHLTPEEKARRRAEAKKTGGLVKNVPKKPEVYKVYGPAYFMPEGDNFIVENLTPEEGPKEIVDCSTRTKVMVRGCDGLTLYVRKKVNCVVIEECKRTNVILCGAVGGVEVTKSSNIK